MKKKNGRFTTVILVIVLLAGLSLLLYPTVSNYWNSLHQTKAIATYSESVAAISDEEYARLWNNARNFNSRIPERSNVYVMNDSEQEEYESLLNVDGSGVMGYVEIPEIDVMLPIYHGTSEAVLQVAVGHLEWTSLPVGGVGTHCVLSGHRGLPSAKLFTNLDKLETGDTFTLNILDDVLTYEVDQILIVLPSETSALQIVENEDYCTLVTCTPYGINTHRLLVRGHRIETEKEAPVLRVTSEALQIDTKLVALTVALPILLFLLIVLLIGTRKRR